MPHQRLTNLQGSADCSHRIGSDNQQRDVLDSSAVFRVLPTGHVEALASTHCAGRRPRLTLAEDRRLTVHVSTLERRRAGRAPSFNVVDGLVRDVADAGAGLICERAIEVGRRVMLAISLGDEQLVLCKGVVVWSAAEPEGGASMGIAFEEEQVGLLAYLAVGHEFAEAPRFA